MRRIMSLVFIVLIGVAFVFTTSAQAGIDRQTKSDSRDLKSALLSIDAESHDFVKVLDYELDRSRYDGTAYEDRLNRVAKGFRASVSRFQHAYMNGKNERILLRYAKSMLDVGADLNRMLDRATVSQVTADRWRPIYRDLLEIARWHRSATRSTKR